MSGDSGTNVVRLGDGVGQGVGQNDSTILDRITSSHTSELVIALCGPIGSPLHKVADALENKLKTVFNYSECEQIRLSRIIEKYTRPVSRSLSAYDRVTALINQGDELRSNHGAGVIAELAVGEIAINRQKTNSAIGGDVYTPRRVCHIIDSIKNQEELDLLRLVYRDMLYFVGVYSPLPAREHALESDGMSQREIYDLIDRDSGEEIKHGQTVRKTFPQADFFLRIEANTDRQIDARVIRFLELILGSRVATPTTAETAMYAAASASGNSACISRQVGAAITDKDGVILGVGWNDVPKFSGGLYQADPVNDPNSENDHRCWNLQGGICFNDKEKKAIATKLVETLVSEGILTDEQKERAVQSVVDDSKVGDLIEFSRAVHAEMQAILVASRLGGERVIGGKLFCTTYPCHSCARHIVAAGITEVYYIEPYRKSLAVRLHSDAITEDEKDHNKVRILPYDGVAPSRYLKLFRVPQDSRKRDGRLITVDERSATPRFDKTVEAMPVIEGWVVDGLVKKKLIKEAPSHE
jgi:deoxycytidylate deaminase